MTRGSGTRAEWTAGGQQGGLQGAAAWSGPTAARSGPFIVIEGGDGAGRSTQVRLLLPWLQQRGWAALHVGLGRSDLARPALRALRRTPEAGATTRALIYSADLHEQAERQVLPALQSGFAVVADRWCPSARARCIARGTDAAWLDGALPEEPPPDLVLHLSATPQTRLERQARKRGIPAFSEAGRDLGLDRDPARSFLRFQGLLDTVFEAESARAGDRWIDLPADGPPLQVHAAIRGAVAGVLETFQAAGETP